MVIQLVWISSHHFTDSGQFIFSIKFDSSVWELVFLFIHIFFDVQRTSYWQYKWFWLLNYMIMITLNWRIIVFLFDSNVYSNGVICRKLIHFFQIRTLYESSLTDFIINDKTERINTYSFISSILFEQTCLFEAELFTLFKYL